MATVLPIITSLQSAAAKTGVGVQRRFQVPWILVIIVLMVIAGMAVFQETRSDNTLTVQPEQRVETIPEVTEIPSVQTEQIVSVPIIPEVEVPWVLLGTGRPVTETMDRLEIPWRNWNFLSAVETEKQLNYAEDGGGTGDGTAYLLYNSSSFSGSYTENPELYFTPDKGKTWFNIANPYPGKSITSPEVGGASIEGNNLVLYIKLQPEPWVRAWWKAEIPLNKIERLALN